MAKQLFSGLVIAFLVLLGSGRDARPSEASSQGQTPPATPPGLQGRELNDRALGVFENPSVVYTDVDERTGSDWMARRRPKLANVELVVSARVPTGFDANSPCTTSHRSGRS